MEPESPDKEEGSELYLGQTIGGQAYTIADYARLWATQIDELPTLICPKCLEEKEYQPIIYSPTEARFFHQKVSRECYQDERYNDRHHPLISQIILARWINSDRHGRASTEFELKKKKFDCGATLSGETLDGVVAEVQHKCGGFRRRIQYKLEEAADRNFGIFVVFSPHEDSKDWFERRLRAGLNRSASAGIYVDGNVRLGTMIGPGEIDPAIFNPDYEFEELELV